MYLTYSSIAVEVYANIINNKNVHCFVFYAAHIPWHTKQKKRAIFATLTTGRSVIYKTIHTENIDKTHGTNGRRWTKNTNEIQMMLKFKKPLWSTRWIDQLTGRRRPVFFRSRCIVSVWCFFGLLLSQRARNTIRIVYHYNCAQHNTFTHVIDEFRTCTNNVLCCWAQQRHIETETDIHNI